MTLTVLGLFPDEDAGPGPADLARLRQQRILLTGLRDEVEAAGRRVATQEADGTWRSAAQRAYGRRLTELAGELQGVWRAVDDALSAADAAIDAVKAEL